MKKLLMSTAVLMMLSISIFLFQMSCTKKSEATPPPQEGQRDTLVIIKRDTVWMKEPVGIQQKNKMIYTVFSDGGGSNANGIEEDVWMANYDGTDKVQLEVNFPSGYGWIENVKTSPDGEMVFFTLGSVGGSSEVYDIYSAEINGAALGALKKVAGSNKKGTMLQVVY